MSWRTFWLEQTDREVRGLRRYTHLRHVAGTPVEWTCETGWHQAIAFLPGDFHAPITEDGLHSLEWDEDLADDDPRWPVECGEGCGYRFGDDDARQPWAERVWRRTDTGEPRVMHQGMVAPGYVSAEAGAMWDAAWMRRPGPDGICLTVRCPRGDGSPGMMLDWPVDWPSSGSGTPWARSGNPRKANVTASPSIAIGIPGTPGFYHGFLQDGVLTDHLG